MERDKAATHPSNGPPDWEPAIRAVAMPADANPFGDIFGGWLLSQMDLAGGTVAARRAKGRTATIAVTGMSFHRPVLIGDEVTCYAQIIRVGTTSITVKVESWVRRGTGQKQIAVTEGIFTYVAVGSDRRPRAVPAEGPIPDA
jgi:acyl-CoA thioesterase YciA